MSTDAFRIDATTGRQFAFSAPGPRFICTHCRGEVAPPDMLARPLSWCVSCRGWVEADAAALLTRELDRRTR